MHLRSAAILSALIIATATAQAFASDNNKRQLAAIMPGIAGVVRPPATIAQRQKQGSGRYLKPGDAGYAYITNKLPPDLPVPLIPGGKVLGADEVVTPGGRGFYVRYRLPHDSADVVNWYRQALVNAGWKLSQSVPVQDANGHIHLSAYMKGAGVSMIVANANESDGRTDVIMNVTWRQ